MRVKQAILKKCSLAEVIGKEQVITTQYDEGCDGSTWNPESYRRRKRWSPAWGIEEGFLVIAG